MDSCSVIGWVSLVVVLDGLAALFGGLVPDRVLRRWRPAMFGFAAGTLLASGAADVFPQALDRLGSAAALWGIGAIAALATFELATSRRQQHALSPVTPVALLGSDALHNFGDGMAIAAAFLVSPHLGLYTSIAVIVHELPEELADYALLRTAGFSKRRALAFLGIVQMTAAIGAASALLASRWLVGVEGVVFATAAGMFIYISAIDLLPVVVRSRSWNAWIAFGIGAAFALFG